MIIVSTILAVLLAVLFVSLGAGKLLAIPSMRDRAAHVGFTVGAYRGIGVLEIAGALGVLGGIVWWPIGAAAGVGLVLLMIGALATHLRSRDSVGEFAPSVVVGVLSACYLVALFAASR